MISLIYYCRTCDTLGDCDCGVWRTAEKRAVCDQCQHVWAPRSDRPKPVRCPQCRTTDNAFAAVTPPGVVRKPSERPGKVSLLLWLPADLKGQFKAACGDFGVSMNSAIVQLMDSWILSAANGAPDASDVPKPAANVPEPTNTTAAPGTFVW